MRRPTPAKSRPSGAQRALQGGRPQRIGAGEACRGPRASPIGAVGEAVTPSILFVPASAESTPDFGRLATPLGKQTDFIDVGDAPLFVPAPALQIGEHARLECSAFAARLGKHGCAP